MTSASVLRQDEDLLLFAVETSPQARTVMQRDLEPIQDYSLVDFPNYTIKSRMFVFTTLSRIANRSVCLSMRTEQIFYWCLLFLFVRLAGRYKIRVVSVESPDIQTTWQEIVVGKYHCRDKCLSSHQSYLTICLLLTSNMRFSSSFTRRETSRCVFCPRVIGVHLRLVAGLRWLKVKYNTERKRERN